MAGNVQQKSSRKKGSHLAHRAGWELLRGPEGYKDDYHRWRAAFPDGEVTIARQLGLVN